MSRRYTSLAGQRNPRQALTPILGMALCLWLTLPGQALAQIRLDDAASNREEAVDIALDHFGSNAKVLGVRRKQSDTGQRWFEVKLLSNGKVVIFRVDKR